MKDRNPSVDMDGASCVTFGQSLVTVVSTTNNSLTRSISVSEFEEMKDIKLSREFKGLKLCQLLWAGTNDKNFSRVSWKQLRHKLLLRSTSEKRNTRMFCSGPCVDSTDVVKREETQI